MYVSYAELNKLEAEILYSSFGHVILKICGDEVYSHFKHESGNHVVQRIPKNQSRGLKQTSYVTVGILPLFNDINYQPLPMADLDITTMRTKIHAGGQNSNKVDSTVRIVHKPTGLSVVINGRDQHSNKREALKVITARVHAKWKEDNDEKYAQIRKETMSDGGRGEKVRTYNFLKSRVSDHRLDKKTSNIKVVMKGNLSFLFKN